MTSAHRRLAVVIAAVFVIGVATAVLQRSERGTAAPSNPAESASGEDPGAEGRQDAVPSRVDRVAAVAPGTYRYRIERRQPGAAPQVVEAATAVFTGTGDNRTEERDYFGTRVRRDYRWRDKGVVRAEIAMTLVQGGSVSRCAWSPVSLSLRLPMTAGAQWGSESTCTLAVNGGQVAVRVGEQVRVEGIERITEAGATLDAVRLVRSIVTASTVDGREGVRRTERTEWLSIAHGLVVRALERNTETVAGVVGERQFEIEEKLLSFVPS